MRVNAKRGHPRVEWHVPADRRALTGFLIALAASNRAQEQFGAVNDYYREQNGATITDTLDGKSFSAYTVMLTAAEVNSGLTFHPGRLTTGTLTVTASMTEGGGLATSAPLTISLSDPPVHHQTLGSLIHQHAANLDLIEQLHTHLANPDLLLPHGPEGHDGSNTLSYSSPGIQDTALLAAPTHRMIEAMASFDANPAGIDVAFC
jgi:hypothetical protein